MHLLHVMRLEQDMLTVVPQCTNGSLLMLEEWRYIK